MSAPPINVIFAQTALIRAAIACLAADHARDDTADADAQVEYAYEQVALAARELTRAVDALDPSERPVGWNPPSSCCNGTGYADYAAVPCPAPDCPVTRPAATP